jgi:hypothetical protein
MFSHGFTAYDRVTISAFVVHHATTLPGASRLRMIDHSDLSTNVGQFEPVLNLFKQGRLGRDWYRAPGDSV